MQRDAEAHAPEYANSRHLMVLFSRRQEGILVLQLLLMVGSLNDCTAVLTQV